MADFSMLLAYEEGFAKTNKPSWAWDEDKTADLFEHIANLEKLREKKKAAA